MSRKKARQERIVSREKSPERKESPESFLNMNPVWSFRRCDMESEKWSLFHHESDLNDVIMHLKDFEGMTWGDIQSSSGGRRHGTNSHYIDVADISKEAQNRLEQLKIYEDQLFSLRISGKKRIWGILPDEVFRIIWYDPKHEIYPTAR